MLLELYMRQWKNLSTTSHKSRRTRRGSCVRYFSSRPELGSGWKSGLELMSQLRSRARVLAQVLRSGAFVVAPRLLANTRSIRFQLQRNVSFRISPKYFQRKYHCQKLTDFPTQLDCIF
jgi:hypothetical protein